MSSRRMTGTIYMRQQTNIEIYIIYFINTWVWNCLDNDFFLFFVFFSFSLVIFDIFKNSQLCEIGYITFLFHHTETVIYNNQRTSYVQWNLGNELEWTDEMRWNQWSSKLCQVNTKFLFGKEKYILQYGEWMNSWVL